MSLADDRETPDESPGSDFVIEDINAGLHANGFGRLGDGRGFAFRIEHNTLFVEVYRPRTAGPVPQVEDVVATGQRSVIDLDVFDERSVSAAVRDCVAQAARGHRDPRHG